MNTANAYHVEAVETCKAPREIARGDWCRYILANNRSRIVGRYRGSLLQARRNAEGLADGLNSRVRNGQSPWASRGRGRAKKAVKQVAAH